jgi:hypothetical protein
MVELSSGSFEGRRMKFARDLFVEFAANAATSLRFIGPSQGPSLSMPAPGGKKSPQAKQAIERNIAKTWFLTTLCTIIVSGILLGLSWFVLNGFRPGVVGATFLWAVLFGWFFTFFVQAKVVSAVFGALLGSGTHNLVTGSGFVTATQGYIEKATKVLPFLPIGSLGTNPEEFIGWMVWLFFVLITLFCFPALFRD